MIFGPDPVAEGITRGPFFESFPFVGDDELPAVDKRVGELVKYLFLLREPFADLPDQREILPGTGEFR